MNRLGYILGGILVAFCVTMLFLIDYSSIGSTMLLLLNILGIIIGSIVIIVEYHQNKE